MPYVRSVSVGIWLGTGSRGESPESNGIAHFIEHMVFKGTERRTAEEIAQSMDSLGGMLDAFTAKEMTCFNAKVLDEHLRLPSTCFPTWCCARDSMRGHCQGKAGRLEEIKMDEDNPESVIHEMFTRISGADIPWACRFWALPKQFRNFRATRCSSGFARGSAEQHRDYGRGNLEHARLVDMVARALAARREPAKGRRTRRPNHMPASNNAQAGTRASAHRAGRAVVSAGARAALRASLLNIILGGGMSSRLFQNIRERQGWRTQFSAKSPVH